MTFTFITDAKSHTYCEKIVQSICRIYGYDTAKALSFINRVWAGRDFTNPLDLMYHESHDYWAKVLVDLPLPNHL